MKKNRIAKSAALAAGFIFLCALPGLARSDNAPNSAVQTPKAGQPKPQPQADSLSHTDFAGLIYTDEQKAEIDKILKTTEANKDVVLKDGKLNADQKDALLVGYSRMEYGSVYKVLSPEQQRLVRQRILARRSADQAAQKRQPPPN